MKRKRKKVTLLTPEEWAGFEERQRSLLGLIERAKIGLATGKRPPLDSSTRSG